MRHIQPIYSCFVILAIAFATSCNSPSSGSNNEHELQVQVKPENSGTVQITGQQVTAQSQPGSVFLYWKIINAGGDFTTDLTDSLTVQKDSVQALEAVFGSTDLFIPVHLKAGPNNKYAWMVKYLQVPKDTSESIAYSAVYRINLQDRSKTKVFTTPHRIRYFDISYKGDFLSYSTTSQNSSSLFDTYIADLKTGESRYAGPGAKSSWANSSNTFLLGSENNLCLYTVETRSCSNLPVDTDYHDGFWAARWSPEDNYILVSRGSGQFLLYQSDTKQRSEIASEEVKEYFTWLDNSTFLTSGPAAGKTGRQVLKYAVEDLNAVEEMPFTAEGKVSVSPSSSQLAFINDGINLYSDASQTSNNVLNYYQWDPKLPVWMDNDNILFYDRQQGMPHMMYPEGKVIAL